MFQIAALFYFVLFVSTGEIAAQECIVGEAVTNPPTSPCSGGIAACEQFCRQKLGSSDYQGARCSEPRGPSGASECLCIARCVRGGCLGEPVCWTFDRTFFSYHGLCKHVLVKPIQPIQPVPYFEVRLTNKPLVGTSTAVVDIVELIVPEWDATIELQNGLLKVSGEAESTPYRMTRYVDGYKLTGLNVTTESWASGIVVETSFGLVVRMDGQNLYIYLPQLPELRGNLVGLLGKWDGDASNDFIGADSITYDPKKPIEATLFGNSWCLTARKTSRRSMLRIQIDVESRKSDLNKCREESKRKPAMAICQQLREPKLAECTQPSGGSADQTVGECELNVCYAGETVDEMEIAAKNFISAFSELCAA